jgi:hypothetical protein
VAEAADTGAHVTLMAQGTSVALSEVEQSQIAKRVVAKPLMATRGRVEISEVARSSPGTARQWSVTSSVTAIVPSP